MENTNLVAISSNLLHTSIDIEVRQKVLMRVYIIVDLYGPYEDRNPFWEGLVESSA
jgi:hypothetical protein